MCGMKHLLYLIVARYELPPPLVNLQLLGESRVFSRKMCLQRRRAREERSWLKVQHQKALSCQV